MEILKRVVGSMRGAARTGKATTIALGERARHLRDVAAGTDVWIRPDERRRTITCGQGDGAWCLCPDGLTRRSVVYSIGVGLDISFDLDVIARFGAAVHAFDPTPISQAWLAAREVPQEFHFHPWGVAAHDGTVEFSLPPSHGVSFTMLDGLECKQKAVGQVLRLDTILERLGHDHIDVLKMDIEGAEYDVIPDIAARAAAIDQVLVEFHHRMIPGAEGLRRTKDAVDRLRAAGYRLFHVSSRALEYSFIRVD